MSAGIATRSMQNPPPSSLFPAAFHALLEPDLSVSKTNVAFDDGYGGDFALPGGTVDYLITVQNSGNAPPNYDSVIVTEALPPELALVITDFAPGSGPVQYQDGSPASGLSCPFVNLLQHDGLFFAFSTDGTNFNHPPTDSGDGTDPAITHVRISPTGFMAPDTGSGATSFTLRFQGKIN